MKFEQLCPLEPCLSGKLGAGDEVPGWLFFELGGGNVVPGVRVVIIVARNPQLLPAII